MDDYIRVFRPAGIADNLNIKKGNKLTYLSKLFHVVPFGKNSRTDIAAFMVFVSLLFILLHEEGHYFEGHRNYNKENSNSNRIKFDEIEGMHGGDRDIMYSKVFEWQADKHAVAGVVDVMLKGDFDFSFSSYSNEPYWRVRTILTAIGSIILLIDKTRKIHGEPENYPSVKTRCISTMVHCIERIQTVDTLKNKYTMDELTDAFHASLFDLSIASLVMHDENDMLPSEKENKYFGFVENKHKSIYEIIECALFRKVKKRMCPNKVYKEWFKELDAIVNIHNTEVFTMLKPYREEVGYYSFWHSADDYRRT